MKTSGEWLGRRDFHEILDVFPPSIRERRRTRCHLQSSLQKSSGCQCLGNPSIAVIPDGSHQESIRVGHSRW
jgi:hypothetical protein